MKFEDVNPLLIRRRKPSRVELDPEVFTFLNGLGRYHTIKEMRQLIIERFGSDRAPSKSSLGRFLSRITREAAKGREDSHGK